MKKICIVGNTIAALVSAQKHIQLGHNVVLISKNNHFGGIFNGLTVFDHHFDYGMLLLEYDSLSNIKKKHFSNYNIDNIHETSRFSSMVNDFFSQLNFKNNKITQPKMFVEKHLYPDFLITNDLTFLLHLSEYKRLTIKKEIKSLLCKKDHLFHAKNKMHWDNNITLYQASINNHGHLFHDLYIEPFIKKIGNISSKKLIARFHRLLWVPLIYPETINYGLSQGADDSLLFNFHYPLGQSIQSAIVQKLVQPLSEFIYLDSISSIQKHHSHYVVQLETRTIDNIDSIIWTDSLDLFCNNQIQVSSLQDKASIGFCFIIINAEYIIEEFSVINIIDTSIPFYRLSNYSHIKGVHNKTIQLTFEYNADYFQAHFPNKNMKDLILDSLWKMQLIQNKKCPFKFEVKKIKRALTLPTPNSEHLLTKSRHTVQNQYTNIIFCGNAAPMGKQSLNEQILQGLII